MNYSRQPFSWFRRAKAQPEQAHSNALHHDSMCYGVLKGERRGAAESKRTLRMKSNKYTIRNKTSSLRCAHRTNQRKTWPISHVNVMSHEQNNPPSNRERTPRLSCYSWSDKRGGRAVEGRWNPATRVRWRWERWRRSRRVCKATIPLAKQSIFESENLTGNNSKTFPCKTVSSHERWNWKASNWAWSSTPASVRVASSRVKAI